MDNAKPTNMYPLVPPNEQKCVWMTAGILSYQLCDREFDCDHCPLDSALRTFPEHAPAELRQTTSSHPNQRKSLMSGYLYSRKHCWIRSTEANSVRIGIEPVLASMLFGAKTVVLPSTGDHLSVNKVCAWIVLEGGTFALESPIDGDVQRTNAMLVDEPHQIHDDPFDRGWVFDLGTNEDIFNRSSLLRIAEADRRYAEDESRFHVLVSTEVKKHRASTGATLADGGVIVKDIAAMLGPEKYFSLLCEAFM